MRKRILFVDDTPRVLSTIRRQLQPMRKEWSMEFVTSGDEALALMDKKPCNILVTDIRMPMMTGAMLLRQVKRRHPATVRVAMAPLSSRDAVMGRIKAAHQYIAKPCDADTLKTVLTRACHIGHLLANVKLRHMVSRLEHIPSLPTVYRELIDAINSPDASVAQVGKIVARDIGMSGKVLQLTNSVFLSRGRHVSDPALAVSLLGLDTIKGLAISSHVFSEFKIDGFHGFSIEDLWNRSLIVALFARAIAEAENCAREDAEDAFISGLLHDVGRLVLASELPEEFKKALALAAEKQITVSEAEREVIGASHSETGGYLMRLWGLADPICDALVFHHQPSRTYLKQFSPLTAVHVANILANELFSWDEGIPEGEIDERHLTDLGLLDRVDAWREACQASLRDKWDDDDS